MDKQVMTTISGGKQRRLTVPPQAHPGKGDTVVVMPVHDYMGLAQARDELYKELDAMFRQGLDVTLAMEAVEAMTALLPLIPSPLPQGARSLRCVACGKPIEGQPPIVTTPGMDAYWPLCKACLLRNPSRCSGLPQGSQGELVKIKFADGRSFMVQPVMQTYTEEE